MVMFEFLGDLGVQILARKLKKRPKNPTLPQNLDWKAEFRFAESRFSQPLYQ